MDKKYRFNVFFFFLFSVFCFLFMSCTFDYGETSSLERMLPDLVMQNVEYVRVRSSDPIARIQAERVERYESQGIMKLEQFSFEQFGEHSEDINAFGRAGFASVNIESTDVFMDRGVRIEINSEDIIIETNQLDWRDGPQTLVSGEKDEVYIYQNNGTNFTGIGLRVDVRRRTWEFSGSVSGIYVHDENEDE